MLHFIRKAGRYARLCAAQYLAVMLGEYQHSGWNRNGEYAKYVWRGRVYHIFNSYPDVEHGEFE